MNLLVASTFWLIWLVAVIAIGLIARAAWEDNRSRLVDDWGRAYFPRSNRRKIILNIRRRV